MMQLKKISIITIIVLFCFTCTTFAQFKNNQLIIFHAGSLSVPFEKIIAGFKKENPGVEVLKEIAGSRECARKITDLKKQCDILAAADYTVIDQLLIPDYASWNLKFATNEMAIVYTEKSYRAKEINQNNWYSIILDKRARIGRADPNADPCGYRAILTLKLADIYYKKEGIAEQVLSKDIEYIRPKEVELLSLLETGEIDYAFLYKSLAEQHGLKYVTLPDKINLKNSDLEDYYKQVYVELNGKTPGERVRQIGGSMVYGVTIPSNAPNPELAKKFLLYLMDKNKGLKILRDEGQPTIVPAVCDNYDKLPAELRKLALKKADKNKKK